MTSETTGWGLCVGRADDELTAAPARVETSGTQTLAQLIDRSYVAVHRFARLQLDAHDAEDVTVEVFTVTLRRLQDVPADPDRAHAWVMAVARRVIWTQIRSLRRRRALLGRLAAQQRPTAVDGASSHADLVVIQRAVMRLGRHDRDVIGLLVAGELDRDGIAQALGCTSAAAGVRIHRARRRLRQALDDEDRAAEHPPAESSPGRPRDRDPDRRTRALGNGT